jgi:hypothetical protein
MPEREIKRALGGKRKHEGGRKLHTHSVKYERAHNGGFHAHVERHTDEGPHHTEHHVLANADDAAAHLQEHMGDQAEMGEQESPQSVEPPEPEEAGAGGGGGAPAAMMAGGGGAGA